MSPKHRIMITSFRSPGIAKQETAELSNFQFRSSTIYLFAQINLRRPNYVGRTATSGVTYRSNVANSTRAWTRFLVSFVFLFSFLHAPLLACHLLLPRQSIVVVTKPWPSIMYVSVFVSSSRPWPLHDVFRSPFFMTSLKGLKEMF
jgi:hypothetical protein